MSPKTLLPALCLISLFTQLARAGTTTFFNPSQTATPITSGTTSDTLSSEGYLFTYSRDKLFTGGTGSIIGRPVSIDWPTGIQAQAVTAGPNPGPARITLSRVDGQVFDLTAFTAKLLANTAGAGGTFEIMPSLNGQDGFNDPLFFDATGIAGNFFSYSTTPNQLGQSTALLKNFDSYTITLYVDFAYTALTLEDASVPEPSTLALAALPLALLTRRRPRPATHPKPAP